VGEEQQMGEQSFRLVQPVEIGWNGFNNRTSQENADRYFDIYHIHPGMKTFWQLPLFQKESEVTK